MPAPDASTRDTVRGHLQEQGRRPWTDLWPGVVGRRLEVIRAVEELTTEQAAWASPGMWPVEAIVRHLLVSSEGVLCIIDDLAHGRPVREGRYDAAPGDLTAHEDAPPLDLSWPDLVRRFIGHSAAFAGIPARLPEPVDMDATFPHEWFGPLTCREWFAFQRIHDGDHLRGIGKVRQAGGFPAGDSA